MESILGIDLGTTSVKVVLVGQYDGKFKVLISKSLRHNANIINSKNSLHFEQSPIKIFSALEQCLGLLKEETGDEMSKIKTLSICGQMHGCVLWNSEDACNTEKKILYPCSSLITWQDQRCHSNFLSSLPLPEKSIPISTGFGCGTLFWLQKNSPEILKTYNCAGTIMDYIIASLCNLRAPVMSTHNAMSWGYFNFIDSKWNVRILEQNGFPVQLLPKIAQPSTIIGTLQRNWCGISSGANILVGLGDMQCSVLSCDPQHSTGIFSLGTSAQLSTISSTKSGIEYYKAESVTALPSSLICVPYFGDFCLWTSASLNGGVVFEKFVKMIYEWTVQFAPSINMDDVYAKLVGSDNCCTASSMNILPTIYGERHEPNKKATIQDIGPDDLHISNFSYELAHGIIKNVFDMFFKSSGSNKKSTILNSILACGTAFEKNNLLRKALEEISGLPCKFNVTMDAAYGATQCAYLL